jgi:hypothetical protein
MVQFLLDHSFKHLELGAASSMLYICYDYAVMGKYLGVDNNWFKNPHISGVSFHDDIVDHIRLID